MIIFKGYGIVVMLIIVGSAFLANLLTNEVSGDDTYWGKHAWLVGVAQIFAGILCRVVGIVIERRYSRVFIVEGTGERVVEHHSFFFIPIKWWCPILIVLGAGIILFDIFL